MDPEEERVLYLSRVGREKIFKYGTYNVAKAREITQDHPFYENRGAEVTKVSYIPPEQYGQPAAESPGPAAAPAPEAAPDDPEALAAQVLSSNFKVGLSQDEVDALLNGMA